MERLKNAPTVWHCAIHCKQRYRKFSSANADLAHFLGRFLPNGRVKRAKNATAADNETSFERFETPRARSFSLNRGPRKVYPDTDPWARSCLCCARPLASTSACELKATRRESNSVAKRTSMRKWYSFLPLCCGSITAYRVKGIRVKSSQFAPEYLQREQIRPTPQSKTVDRSSRSFAGGERWSGSCERRNGNM